MDPQSCFWEAVSALTSHRNVRSSPLGICTAEWYFLCHSVLRSWPDTQGGESIWDITHCLPTCSLVAAHKQEWTGLLVRGDGEGAGAGSAGVTSAQAGGQHIAIFTHFTEITCTVVPAVLKGRLSWTWSELHSDTSLNDNQCVKTYYTNAGDVITVIGVAFAVTR